MDVTTMTPSERHQLLVLKDKALREDFSSFIARCFETVNPGADYLPNWHIDLIAEYLEAMRHSEVTRLIINMPPRALKSICVSVAWPAWLLAQDPTMRIMCASYAQQLSIRHALDTRLILGDSWYQRLFPETCIMRGENEKHKLVTTARGFRFATSVGGTATGEGGDVLIVDDPLNPAQAESKVEREKANLWFDQTFSTRLNDKRKGRIVIVMQRLHVEDLSGHLLEKGDWEHLMLPAIAEQEMIIDFGHMNVTRQAGDILHSEREDKELLERAKRDLGSYAFSAQYQQAPLAHSGGMVEATWLGRYHRRPETYTRVSQSWDTAIKAGSQHDASVCLTFGEHEGQHYMLDAQVMRLEYPALKKQVRKQAETWQPDVILVEDKASGQSLLQDLRRETQLPLIACMPKKDKLTRMAAVSAMIEAGRLILPTQAPWLVDFELELLNFPHAPHDDQVDALSQYLNWIREKQGDGTPGVRRF